MMLGVVLVYLAITYLTFNQIEEDAFIYFRIAGNIAEGHGYVFNAGGEPIESGSGTLWQLLMAALWHAPLHMIVKAKLLGIAFACVALWLTFRIARRLIADPVLQCVPSLLLACSIPFFCWSQRGLETAQHLCVLLLLCEVCCDARLRRFWVVPAVLLCVSRPEGFVLLAALVPFFVMDRGARLGRGVAVVVGFLGLSTLFRLGYFHELVPHPFYIKASTNPIDGLLRQLEYLLHNWIFLLLIACAVGYAMRQRPWSRELVLVISFLVVTALWASVGMEGFAPYFRHFVPVLPFLFVIAVAGIDGLVRGRASTAWVRAGCLAFAVLMLVFSQSSYTRERETPSVFGQAAKVAMRDPFAYWQRVKQIVSDPDMFFADINPAAELQTYNTQLLRDPINTHYQATAGKFVRANYPEGISFVYDQMGQTPWYAGSDKKVIDSYGLLSKSSGYFFFQKRRRVEKSVVLDGYDAVMTSLARWLWPDETRDVGAQAALDSIFEQNPELILVNDFGTQYVWHIPSRLTRDPRLRARYREAFLVNGIMRVYERNDLEWRERMFVPRGAKVVGLRPPSD